MRRRLGTLIPFVVLAVLAQFMAPIGLSRAVARAMSDPLAMAPICSGLSDAGHNSSTPASPTHADCCSFCGLGYGGSAVPIAPSAIARVSGFYRSVVWQSFRDVSSPERSGSNAQARAPPAVA
jgi:Protein of unknown function (DUF2946)